jgi:hypothetical protein
LSSGEWCYFFCHQTGEQAQNITVCISFYHNSVAVLLVSFFIVIIIRAAVVFIAAQRLFQLSDLLVQIIESYASRHQHTDIGI